MTEPKRKNKFDFVSKEQRTKCINEIIAFFQDKRDEKIGFIAAEEVMDFFLQKMGEEIYKKALNDCRKLFKERFEDLEVELDLLLPK